MMNKIGETIQEATQIGKECHTGCEIAKVEGIFIRIIKGGIIKSEDTIKVI